jgi:hypothetical protein
VKDLANKWLAFQEERVSREELRAGTWKEYKEAAGFALRALGAHVLVAGLRPEDFGPLRSTLADKYGYDGLNKFIKIVRMIFRWGYENGVVAQPVRFGDFLKSPGLKAKLLARREKKDLGGERFFPAIQIRKQLAAASKQMRAMILLGINGGYGNTDCAQLRVEFIDFHRRVIDHARAKTLEGRLVPLWPETITALKEVIGDRQAGLVFLTRLGNAWVREELTRKDGRIDQRQLESATGDNYKPPVEVAFGDDVLDSIRRSSEHGDGPPGQETYVVVSDGAVATGGSGQGWDGSGDSPEVPQEREVAQRVADGSRLADTARFVCRGLAVGSRAVVGEPWPGSQDIAGGVAAGVSGAVC